jgi:hypothetical protein
MNKRFRSVLGYLTPPEFEAHWLAQQAVCNGVMQ